MNQTWEESLADGSYAQVRTVGGVIIENAPPVDIVGAYLIAGYIGCVSIYLSWCWFSRWWRSRGRMGEVLSGKLRLAAATGRVDILAAMQESVKDFDIDASVCGFTALHAACCQCQLNSVLWLCQMGADVNAVKHDGWSYTSLHYAACHGDLQCVQVLCAFGANVESKAFHGATPAEIAAEKGHSEVASYLDSVASNKVVPDIQQYEGQMFVREQNEFPWTLVAGQIEPCASSSLESYLKRGYEGMGTPGTSPAVHLRGFRVLAVLYLGISASYLVWRALRSLNPGWWYFYSSPFWIFEVFSWTLGLCFVYSLYYQIDRPGRDIAEILEQEEFPRVDIFICRYSEPVEVLEATVVAALNIDYPGKKLCVHILDDGKSKEVKAMHRRLGYQLRYMGREATLKYISRPKVAGVQHHAKAGNINHCLLTESSVSTDYILVLDCDMIIHPTFLRRTLAHFFRENDYGSWCQKDFAALLQTPQDFWNVDSDDPMVHCARFFYGPMLKGRDGAGACPCCGTGVLFKRDILVSIGGQSYGSITEDCNTAMQLLSSGFANMFMDERLVYGMAPETISGVFKQRLRWAMGALQILYRDNPLRKRGLTMSQSFLFFEIGAHHYLAIGTALMAVVPLFYIFLSVSPVVVQYLWEFCIVFSVFFTSNRLMMWWAHRGCTSGGSLELWRGGQMWVWMCPNHIKAIVKTFFGESSLHRLFNFEITFHVTEKRQISTNVWCSLLSTWPLLLYFFASMAALIFFIVMTALQNYSAWEIVMAATAVAWCLYICLCIWPPISVLLPRIETEQGWKISWDEAIDESMFVVDEKKRVVKKRSKKSKRILGTKYSQKIREMEEGNDQVLAELTNNIVDKFRPASSSENFISPFDLDYGNRSSCNIQRAQSKISANSSKKEKGGRRMLSSAIASMNIFRSKSEKTQERRSGSPGTSRFDNIGRIALPQKTGKQFCKSAIFTSMILPEPVGISRNASTRIDTRHLSLGQLLSQAHSRIESGPKQNIEQKLNDNLRSLCNSALRSAMASIQTKPTFEQEIVNRANNLHITDEGRVFKENEEVGVGALTENIITHLNLRNHSNRSSDFLSPFLEYESNEMDENDDETGEKKGMQSMHKEGSKKSHSGQCSTLQGINNSSWQGQSAGADGNVPSWSTEIHPVSYTNEMQRMLSLPVRLNPRDVQKCGKELLRSMELSRIASFENTQTTDWKNDIPEIHIHMGERATDVLRSRIANQPGSIILSHIFAELSQMQPSALEKAGFVLPVVPDSIFDHTIASKPSFEFRVLPSKTLMFFAINFLILGGVLTGGILAIFFGNDAV